jgi:hypothetical protein
MQDRVPSDSQPLAAIRRRRGQIFSISAPADPQVGSVKTAHEGPNPHFSEPSALFVAVGNNSAGPAPQINFLTCVGEKKKVETVSPSPIAPPLGSVASG